MLRQASISRAGRGLDHVQVDPVGEHLANLAAAEHQHPGVLGGGDAQGRHQPIALAGGHRAVIDPEDERPDRPTAPVADLPIARGRRRHLRQPIAQRHGGRQLQPLPAHPTDMADPDGHVAGVISETGSSIPPIRTSPASRPKGCSCRGQERRAAPDACPVRGLCGPFSVPRRPVGELKRPLGDAAPPDTGG